MKKLKEEDEGRKKKSFTPPELFLPNISLLYPSTYIRTHICMCNFYVIFNFEGM